MHEQLLRDNMLRSTSWIEGKDNEWKQRGDFYMPSWN